MQPQAVLDNNNLHFKPITGWVFQGIRFAGTSIHQSASPNRWHGHLVRGISYGIVATGYVINAFLALAESILAFTVGFFASMLHRQTNAESVTLHKFTLKCLAYAINGLGVSVGQSYLLCTGNFPQYHTLNTLINHGLHIGSAIVSQLIFGRCFDQVAGRNPQDPNQMTPSVTRSIGILVENIPPVVTELLASVDRDLGVPYVVRDADGNEQVSSFFDQYPQHRGVLQSFNLNNLADPEQRRAVAAFINDYSTYRGIGRANIGGANNILVLNNNGQADRQYQAKLKEYVKDSFKEIYQNDNLVSCLSSEASLQAAIKAGKESMDMFDADIYIPLANYAQLKELQNDIECPNRFENAELRRLYPTRYDDLTAAKVKVDALTSEETAILVKKLLKGSSLNYSAFNISIEQERHIQEAFTMIGRLSGSLHQGKLMNQLQVDLRNLGNMNHCSLFQEACQDAWRDLQ